MNDHRWFRLYVRGIGLLLIGMNATALLSALGTLVAYLVSARGGNYSFFQSFLGLLGYGVGLSLGVYLLCGANSLIRYCLRQVEQRCANCDYDFRSLPRTTEVCPECGVRLPTARGAPEVTETR